MALLSGLSLSAFLYTFVICLIITLAIFKWFRERKYPPGPAGVPILGYSAFLGKNPHKKLRDLSQKYGGIFSMYLGTDLFVCITDYAIFKDLLCHPALLFRSPEEFSLILGRGGIGGLNGDEWQEQRRFTFHTMRNLGLGKGQWEILIQENIMELIEEIKDWKGQPKYIENPISKFQTITSISLLFGRHLDKEKDAETLKILYSTREPMKYFSAVSVNINTPWLRTLMLFFNIGGCKRIFELLRKLENVFKKEVEERLKLPESFVKEDFIGCFFLEMEKKEKETKNHSFSPEILMGNLISLFFGGNESTLLSICWLLLHMADRPEVQKKVHEEIDSVIGRDGVVSYDDRNKFPYTMATMFEMLRWVSIAPIFPARFAMEDIECNGYTIPKGAHVICNAWAMMRDPRYFENPDEFEPERFFSGKGAKIFTKIDGYAPFSIGKRNCPGEGVAMMTMFLYFVSIMQKFKVTMPAGKVADLDPVFGNAMLPKPQNLCFMER